MKRALGLALVAVMLLPAGAAAQDRSEISAWWDMDRTITLIDTGVEGVFGLPDDDFCSAMSAVLGVKDTADIDACVKYVGEPDGLFGMVMVPETWLNVIGDAPSSTSVEAKPVKVSGKGSKKTKPFMLASGDYEITFKKAKGCDEFTYGYLTDAARDFSPSGEVSQNGYVYGIEEGRHYWEAEANDKCKWTYILKPLD